ncbi:hypothetical protein KVR01_005202 [Diaporthe batatas]|uniref:uncharacterized protein n=1 Tax=Diaporthe batatas TaxID=748121 RepID=UPI001D04F467|nr:uncharacterized protein KVR01_005202 [Diaporthe batatas]KAG8164927.1 hypothetical protein KVR01_005202 [Diaporthe batatas]
MLPITLRNALLSLAVVLPTHVLADGDVSSSAVTFQFSACVSTCLGSSGYSIDGEDNQKEMCKASRDGLLEAIIACAVSNCVGELVSVEATLLQPMQAGCKELEKPVSDDEIEAAVGAALDIQATLAISTSASASATSTSSTSSTQLAAMTPTGGGFRPFGVETETSTTAEVPAIPMPTEQTLTAIDSAAETTMLIPTGPLTVVGTTTSEAVVPAETPSATPEPVIASEAQPPPEPVTSAEEPSQTSSEAAAIVPVAQATQPSAEQAVPEATTVSEPPPSPTPDTPPAPQPTPTHGGHQASQVQPEPIPATTLATTMTMPTSTNNAADTQPQHTPAAHEQPPNDNNNNSPVAGAGTTTTSTEASKTEGSAPSKATHTADASKDSDSDSDSDSDDDTLATATGSATPDISGELVLATGTPTATPASWSGFATSVTAVTATPSASGTQAADSGEDRGLGGGSPFSVVTSSMAPGTTRCLLAPLGVVFGVFVSLMML